MHSSFSQKISHSHQKINMRNQDILIIIEALKSQATTLRRQKAVETKLLNYFRYIFNNNEEDAIEVEILKIILDKNKVNISSLDDELGKSTKNRLTAVRDTLFKYLGTQRLEQSNIYPYFFSQRKLMDLGLSDLFESRYKSLMKKIEDEPHKIADIFFPYHISSMKFEFDRNKHNDDLKVTFQNTIDDFKIFILTQSLYFKCVLIIEQNPKTKAEYLDDLINSIEKNKSILQKNDFLELYYFTYQLLKNGEKKYENKLKKKRDEMWKVKSISSSEYRKISMWLIEYYNFMGDLGNMSNTYDDLQEKSLLITPEHPYIQPPIFKNIVAVHVRLKKFEPAKSFIEGYQNKLPKNERKYYTYYAKGIYYFYTNDFEESKEYLEESLNNVPEGLLKRTQPLYLNTSTLLIRTYIELMIANLDTPKLTENEYRYENLKLKLSALRTYIRNNEIPSEKHYLGFLSLGDAIRRVLEAVLDGNDLHKTKASFIKLKAIEAPTFVTDWFSQILPKLEDAIN